MGRSSIALKAFGQERNVVVFNEGPKTAAVYETARALEQHIAALAQNAQRQLQLQLGATVGSIPQVGDQLRADLHRRPKARHGRSRTSASSGAPSRASSRRSRPR